MALKLLTRDLQHVTCCLSSGNRGRYLSWRLGRRCIPGGASRTWYSTSVGTNMGVSQEPKLGHFAGAYRKYLDAIGGPDEHVLKKDLKRSAKELVPYLEHCDRRTVTEVLLALEKISRRCKCLELNTAVIHKVLEILSTGSRGMESGSSNGVIESGSINNVMDSGNSNSVMDVAITNMLAPSDVDKYGTDETLAYLLLHSVRAFEFKNADRSLVDALVNIVSTNLYRWDVMQLVQVCRELAWVCRFHHHEGCGTLLRKALVLVCDKAIKSGVQLDNRQIITLMKAVSVTTEPDTLCQKINHLVASLITREETITTKNDIDGYINKSYKRAKGNVHLLYAALVTKVTLKPNVVDAMLGSVASFCHEYFEATCRYWKLDTDPVSYTDYNKIDPRVVNILYAKCTNKILRLPGSLDPTNNPEPRAPKLEERYQAVVAALSRLYQNGKYAFCRGLKLCEARLRVMDPGLYRSLGDGSHAFLRAVSCFKPGDPQSIMDDSLYKALRRLGYRAVPIVVDGLFEVNCIDHKRKLYCNLCNQKEVYLTSDNKPIRYNAYTQLKLRYLEACGWHGVLLSQPEWERLTPEGRIALLREKLSVLETGV